MDEAGRREAELERLAAEIRACRVCVDSPRGKPLPHAPRPVLRVSASARIAVCGQAPGTRVHASGVPFSDPSGVRLRQWMGVSDAEFYDVSRVAVVPMGFCFPGLNGKGGDLPPRRECAEAWRARVVAALPQVELWLLVGRYAHAWHLGVDAGADLTATVRRAGEILAGGHLAGGRAREPAGDQVCGRASDAARCLPLPHPSWRNNAWLSRNPWFGAEVVPLLQHEVRRLLLC